MPAGSFGVTVQEATPLAFVVAVHFWVPLTVRVTGSFGTGCVGVAVDEGARNRGRPVVGARCPGVTVNVVPSGRLTVEVAVDVW